MLVWSSANLQEPSLAAARRAAETEPDGVAPVASAVPEPEVPVHPSTADKKQEEKEDGLKADALASAAPEENRAETEGEPADKEEEEPAETAQTGDKAKNVSDEEQAKPEDDEDKDADSKDT